VFLDKDGKNSNRLTYVKEKGYRWKFYNTSTKSIIDKENPSPE
jgi:hypothetical protein